MHIARHTHGIRPVEGLGQHLMDADGAIHMGHTGHREAQRQSRSAADATRALTLKNTAEDKATRLVAGRVEYLGAEGQRLALAPDRANTSFEFSSWTTGRLDPGEETTTTLDLPFPAAAFQERSLENIRLEIAHVPVPYREEAVTLQIALAPKS
jgi:hypothetical protein